MSMLLSTLFVTIDFDYIGQSKSLSLEQQEAVL